MSKTIFFTSLSLLTLPILSQSAAFNPDDVSPPLSPVAGAASSAAGAAVSADDVASPRLGSGMDGNEFSLQELISKHTDGQSPIKNLSLYRIELTEPNCAKLATILPQLTQLTELSADNTFPADPESVRPLIQALASHPTLKGLNLYEAQIPKESLIELIESLKTNATLETLNMAVSSNEEEEEEAGHRLGTAFGEYLRTNSSLTSLDLSTLNIGDDGAVPLALGLKANTTLTTLNLSSNNLWEKGITAIAMALRENTTLRTLHIAYNNFDDREAEEEDAPFQESAQAPLENKGGFFLGQMLGINHTLTTLDLESCEINFEIAQYLARGLGANTALTTLSLQENKLGDESASALARALQTNQTLTSLNLAANYIGDHGTSALAQALCTNTTLTSLDLSGNLEMTDTGVQALADALRVNTTLTSLNLARVAISDAGARALEQAIAVNQTLTSLNLEDTGLDWEFQNRMNTRLAQHRS